MPDRDRTVLLLREQARSCQVMGSPLYAGVLELAAEDAAAGGPTFTLLEAERAPGSRGDALALRLLAAGHRLALEGHAPELAALLPSTRAITGTPQRTGAPALADPVATFTALRNLMVHEAAALGPLIARPCQTNEVGRAAALAFGFCEAASSSHPLRLLEVGASAGLNLRLDHFRFGGGGATLGPEDSPVNLEGLWQDRPANLPTRLPVAERRGCDLWPVDPTTDDGRIALLSSVWADQEARFGRLRGAIELAARIPAKVDTADIADWLPGQLREKRRGIATVVYHSIVDEYLPEATRQRFHETLRDAGGRATAEAPLFWIRLEPFPGNLEYGVTLTRWPGGEEHLVARSGAHGSDVRRT
jgi:hypothetical protein